MGLTVSLYCPASNYFPDDAYFLSIIHHFFGAYFIELLYKVSVKRGNLRSTPGVAHNPRFRAVLETR